MTTLTLSAYSLSVTLSRFGSGNYPRERINTNDISRTAYGTVQRQGTAYEPPHLWQVVAILDSTAQS